MLTVDDPRLQPQAAVDRFQQHAFLWVPTPNDRLTHPSVVWAFRVDYSLSTHLPRIAVFRFTSELLNLPETIAFRSV